MTNETIPAIMREMRELAAYRDWQNHTNQSNRERIDNLAGRLNAALAREHETADLRAIHAAEMAERDTRAALAREAPPSGNVAKLREALRESTSLLAIVDGSEYKPEITAQIDRNTGVLADTQAIAAPAQEPTPKKFDEAAFDAAVRGMNGWDAVADPVAEIRRMRDGDAPGNAAAMRKALEAVLRYFRSGVEHPDCLVANSDVWSLVERAISAPARNCDVGTADEQKARHDRFCSRHYKPECVDSQCFGCPAHDEKTETDCEFVWGQLPFVNAEGGAE